MFSRATIVGRVYVSVDKMPIKCKTIGWETADYFRVGLRYGESIDFPMAARDFESVLHKMRAFDMPWKFGCGIALLHVEPNDFEKLRSILTVSASCLLGRHYETIAVFNPLPVRTFSLPGSDVKHPINEAHFVGLSEKVSFTVCVSYPKDAHHYATGDVIPGVHLGVTHAPKGMFCSCGREAKGKCACGKGSCGQHLDDGGDPSPLCSSCLHFKVMEMQYEEGVNRSVEGEVCDCGQEAEFRCLRCTEPSCEQCGAQGLCGYCAHMCLKDD